MRNCDVTDTDYKFVITLQDQMSDNMTCDCDTSSTRADQDVTSARLSSAVPSDDDSISKVLDRLTASLAEDDKPPVRTLLTDADRLTILDRLQADLPVDEMDDLMEDDQLVIDMSPRSPDQVDEVVDAGQMQLDEVVDSVTVTEDSVTVTDDSVTVTDESVTVTNDRVTVTDDQSTRTTAADENATTSSAISGPSEDVQVASTSSLGSWKPICEAVSSNGFCKSIGASIDKVQSTMSDSDEIQIVHDGEPACSSGMSVVAV